MVLALPIVTIALIAGVSFVIIILIIVGIARSTCCSPEKKGKKKSKKKGARQDELDRFLATDDESGTEYISKEVTEKKVPSKDVLDMYNAAFEDDEIHFVAEQNVDTPVSLPDIVTMELPEHVQTESLSAEPISPETVLPEADRISVGIDVLVEENTLVVGNQAPILTTPSGSMRSYSIGNETPRKMTPLSTPRLTPKPTPNGSPKYGARNSPVPLRILDSTETTSIYEMTPAEQVLIPETAISIELGIPEETIIPDPKESSVTFAEPISPIPDSIADGGSLRDITENLDNTGAMSDDTLSNEPPYNRPSSRKHLTLGRLSRSTHRINSTFSEQATLKITLHYIASIKCLRGNISEMNGLNYDAENAPNHINFHLRFFPVKKFHVATKYKPIITDENPLPLNLTFTLGPVFQEDLEKNKLRVKLYGKKAQRIARSKCYGECAIHLEDMIGQIGEVQFVEAVSQRVSSGAVSSDSDGLM